MPPLGCAVMIRPPSRASCSVRAAASFWWAEYPDERFHSSCRLRAQAIAEAEETEDWPVALRRF